MNYRYDEEVLDFWAEAATAAASWMNTILFADRYDIIQETSWLAFLYPGA